MDRLKRIGISTLASLVGMLGLWAAFFFLAPKIAVPVYLYPGIMLLRLVEVIPDKVLYFLFPSGGLDAAAGFAALFASVFWWFLGTVGIYFVLLASDRRKDKSRMKLFFALTILVIILVAYPLVRTGCDTDRQPWQIDAEYSENLTIMATNYTAITRPVSGTSQQR